MTNQVKVINTLGFLFPAGAAQPTLEEVARFVKTLVADKSELETAYKISEERSVYVKFKCEAAMKRAVKRNPRMHTFQYTNGKVVEVCMSIAGSNIRYVRVFDLPPEIPDLQVSLVLEKYGKVKHVEREKFPADFGLGDVFTGVRGLHIDVEKDIPPVLYFVGRKGRVYHDQMKPKCYICFSEDHLKVTCPNKKASRNMTEHTESISNNTFANVVGGSTSSQEKERTETHGLGNEAEEETIVNDCSSEDKGHQANKSQQQQQKQTALLKPQKPPMSGNWTDYVKQHSKAIKDQQKSDRSSSESSPPRKNHRSNSTSSN